MHLTCDRFIVLDPSAAYPLRGAGSLASEVKRVDAQAYPLQSGASLSLELNRFDAVAGVKFLFCSMPTTPWQPGSPFHCQAFVLGVIMFIGLQMVTNSSVCIIPVRIIHLELVQYVWPAPRNQQGFANQALEPTLAKLGCLKQKQFPCASAIYKHVRVCHTGSQLLPGAL